MGRYMNREFDPRLEADSANSLKTPLRPLEFESVKYEKTTPYYKIPHV